MNIVKCIEKHENENVVPHLQSLRVGETAKIQFMDTKSQLTMYITRRSPAPVMMEYTDPHSFVESMELCHEFNVSYNIDGSLAFTITVPVHQLGYEGDAISRYDSAMSLVHYLG